MTIKEIETVDWYDLAQAAMNALTAGIAGKISDAGFNKTGAAYELGGKLVTNMLRSLPLRLGFAVGLYPTASAVPAVLVGSIKSNNR